MPKLWVTHSVQGKNALFCSRSVHQLTATADRRAHSMEPPWVNPWPNNVQTLDAWITPFHQPLRAHLTAATPPSPHHPAPEAGDLPCPAPPSPRRPQQRSLGMYGTDPRDAAAASAAATFASAAAFVSAAAFASAAAVASAAAFASAAALASASAAFLFPPFPEPPAADDIAPPPPPAALPRPSAPVNTATAAAAAAPSPRPWRLQAYEPTTPCTVGSMAAS